MLRARQFQLVEIQEVDKLTLPGVGSWRCEKANEKRASEVFTIGTVKV